MYAASSVKRQKVVREVTRQMENTETFQGIGRIEFKPDATPSCDDQLFVRYFNASERIHGRSMEEWLRPSVLYRPEMSNFNISPQSLSKTLQLSNNRSMEATKKNIRSLFELCLKLGVKFWSGYKDDLVPEAETFEECQNNYEQICELLNEYQHKTGVKPLWIGVSFNNFRYANGAMTNPDANVMAFAGHQTKCAIEMAHKLNAECFLINGNRENYDNPMNTDLTKELKYYARFLKLLIEHRDKINFRGQLLFSAQAYNAKCNKNMEYYAKNEFDAMLLLKHLNFERYFKINVRPGRAFNMANAYGCQGCIEVTPSDAIKNLTNSTLLLYKVIENGGFGHCGIIFDEVSDAYVEPKELMESYVNALDSYGKSLRLAVKLLNVAQVNKHLQLRYANYQIGWGMKFMTLDASLQDCEEVVKKLYESNTVCTSNKSSHWLVVLQRFIDSQNLK